MANTLQLKRIARERARSIRLARLTPMEDKRWEQLFSWAISSGYSSVRADREAWQGLCEEFPRLRKYDGCKP